MKKIINNKKTLIISCIIFLVILIVCLVCFVFNDTRKRKNYMEDLAKIFYEELYYPQVGSTDKERIDYVDNYTNIGFNMTLKGLLNYTQDKKIKNSFDDCDLDNSKVKIFPKKPFGKSDYKLIITLKCK